MWVWSLFTRESTYKENSEIPTSFHGTARGKLYSSPCRQTQNIQPHPPHTATGNEVLLKGAGASSLMLPFCSFVTYNFVGSVFSSCWQSRLWVCQLLLGVMNSICVPVWVGEFQLGGLCAWFSICLWENWCLPAWKKNYAPVYVQ